MRSPTVWWRRREYDMADHPGVLYPVRARKTAILRSGDVTVIADPGRGEHVALNATALALWELCDGETTVNEMIRAVCSLFDVSMERATSDVESALEQMRQAGVIE